MGVRRLAATFSPRGSSCKSELSLPCDSCSSSRRGRVTALCRGTRSPGDRDGRPSARGLRPPRPSVPQLQTCWELRGTSPSPVQGSLAAGQSRRPRRHALRSARWGITSRRGAERRSQRRLGDCLPAAGRRPGTSPGRKAAQRSRRRDSARLQPQPPTAQPQAGAAGVESGSLGGPSSEPRPS